jgi:hypothetical protein
MDWDFYSDGFDFIAIRVCIFDFYYLNETDELV